jgi:hypothetical protein
MKRTCGSYLFILTYMALLLILCPRLEAQNTSWDQGNEPQNGACFYEDADYQGDRFCASAGENRTNVGDRWNDRISSIRIYGGATVTVFQDEDFKRGSQTFRQDVPNLQSWNDRITSYRVEGRQGYGTSSTSEPRVGACFYVDADYQGERFCVGTGDNQPNVGDRWNDRISSIRIYGGATVTVFQDKDFGGDHQTYSQDVPNLRNWNDRMTSYKVEGGRRNWNRSTWNRSNRTGEVQNNACFYEDADYRGDKFCMNSGESQRNIGDRWNDKISSIRIYGGAQVTVFEHENFKGNSRSFRSDVSNLQDWNDRITSIELR